MPTNGSSQAVRLPVDFRFEGDESLPPAMTSLADVVLSTRPGARTWSEFELMRSIEVPEDYMPQRPMNAAPVDREVFSDQDG